MAKMMVFIAERNRNYVFKHTTGMTHLRIVVEIDEANFCPYLSVFIV